MPASKPAAADSRLNPALNQLAGDPQPQAMAPSELAAARLKAADKARVTD
jgi:hypothetical protein